jgi:DNA-binding NarL/FixJ family response regulator
MPRLAHWPEVNHTDLQMMRAPDDDFSAGGGGPARILIVEDDYLVAVELENQLQEAGFQVVGIAATAEQAIQKAVVEQPALVIMDVRLAGPRDGVDAAIELSQKLGIRSIFATAHSDPHTRQRAEPAKAAGWLQKPYTFKAVIELIRTALASRG